MGRHPSVDTYLFGAIARRLADEIALIHGMKTLGVINHIKHVSTAQKCMKGCEEMVFAIKHQFQLAKMSTTSMSEPQKAASHAVPNFLYHSP